MKWLYFVTYRMSNNYVRFLPAADIDSFSLYLFGTARPVNDYSRRKKKGYVWKQQ